LALKGFVVVVVVVVLVICQLGSFPNNSSPILFLDNLLKLLRTALMEVEVLMHAKQCVC
jgi:hypothetical protein